MRVPGQNPVKIIGIGVVALMAIVMLLWSQCSGETPTPTPTTTPTSSTTSTPVATPDPIAVEILQDKIEDLTQQVKELETQKVDDTKPPQPGVQRCGTPCDVPQACHGLRDQQLWACLRLNAPGQ